MLNRLNKVLHNQNASLNEITPIPAPWILDTGHWDDSGVWKATSQWMPNHLQADHPEITEELS